MRRPRMTTRRWMVVVAIAALLCLGVERIIALRRLRVQQEMIAAFKAREQVRAELLLRVQELEKMTKEIEAATSRDREAGERFEPPVKPEPLMVLPSPGERRR